MILVCPSCDTRYSADAAAIGKAGRRVRCASCGHSWFVQPDGAPAGAEDTGLTREQVERLRQAAAANSQSPSGPHAEFRAREQKRRQRGRLQASVVAWMGGIGIFAGLVTAAVAFRDDVVDTWPRTATLFRMAGLEVNRFGLMLEDVGAKRSFEGTTPVLTVSGIAVNHGEEARPAPEVRVALRDERGRVVESWTQDLGVASIAPGEGVPFESRFEAPPVETQRLTVTFVPKPAPPETGAPAGESAPSEVAADFGHAADETVTHAEPTSAPAEGHEEPDHH